MKTAAVFFADGFEEIEAFTPVDYLRRAGIQVIMVGVIGKKLDNNFIVTSSHDVKVLMDMNINEYLNIFFSEFSLHKLQNHNPFVLLNDLLTRY